METVKLGVDKEYLSKCRQDGNTDKLYGEYVDQLIRERYSLSEEIAINRQRDSKPEDWELYNNYCEECKTRARYIIKEISLDNLTIEPLFPSIPMGGLSPDSFFMGNTPLVVNEMINNLKRTSFVNSLEEANK